ncbi:hypothetical protein THIX_60496 [Thiomonas sp. X19]|nr:hypothetical protein THIX_60496 [Thiomonas sp. X19]
METLIARIAFSWLCLVGQVHGPGLGLNHDTVLSDGSPPFGVGCTVCGGFAHAGFKMRRDCHRPAGLAACLNTDAWKLASAGALLCGLPGG